MPKAKKKTKGSESNSDDTTFLKLDNDRPGRVRKPNTRYFGDDFESSNFDEDSATTTKAQSIPKVKAQAALKPKKAKEPTKTKKPTG